MPKYAIKFDDVAFTEDGGYDGVEIEGKDVADLNRELKASNLFTPGVIAVQHASVFNDDNQPEDGEYKVFTSVTLLVEAANERAAEQFPAPSKLLEAVLEHVKAKSPGGLENEGNWEVLCVEPFEPQSESPDPSQKSTIPHKMGRP